MSHRLEKAFKKLTEELPEYEQDAVGEWLLKLLENDEREWDAQFAASREKLEALADRALMDYANESTEVLDLEKL